MPKLLLVALTATLLAACGSTTDQPKPAQAEPAKSAPAESAKSAEAKPAETKPAEAAKPAEAKPAEAAKPAAADATKPAEAAKPADATQPAAVAAKPADATQPAADAPKPADDQSALPDVVHATIHVPEGDIHVDLFHKTAPISVENFVKLTKQKFFDGLAFHRVEPGFVIQGGDPNTREGATGIPGTGGPGYTIPAENDPAKNPEKHLPGTLGMADAGLNTAGSQFYVTLVATPHLDGRYTVFGRVSADKDLEVVKQVKKGDRFTVTIDEPAK
jgi:peptidyl-prolyl cis-trans isomerase B (cyclophilin B)